MSQDNQVPDIQALLTAAGLDNTTFSPTSRYSGKPLTSSVTADGQPVVHITRRFVPSPEKFALLQFHYVEQGDRLDNIAHKYLADPEQYWKLCDANGVDNPNQLLAAVGRAIRITLPAGVPGGDDA